MKKYQHYEPAPLSELEHELYVQKDRIGETNACEILVQRHVLSVRQHIKSYQCSMCAVHPDEIAVCLYSDAKATNGRRHGIYRPLDGTKYFPEQLPSGFVPLESYRVLNNKKFTGSVQFMNDISAMCPTIVYVCPERDYCNVIFGNVRSEDIIRQLAGNNYGGVICCDRSMTTSFIE